jgi:hypothetical protein
MGNLFDLNELVKSLKSAFFVIPADPGSKPALDPGSSPGQALIQGPGGIQHFQRVTKTWTPFFNGVTTFYRHINSTPSSKDYSKVIFYLQPQ